MSESCVSLLPESSSDVSARCRESEREIRRREDARLAFTSRIYFVSLDHTNRSFLAALAGCRSLAPPAPSLARAPALSLSLSLQPACLGDCGGDHDDDSGAASASLADDTDDDDDDR